MMPVPVILKLALAGGAAWGVWTFFAGSASSTRAPYGAPVRKPGTPALPWTEVDETLCLAFDVVGATNPATLLEDLWRRLYPNVPAPPIPADHASVASAYAELGARVSEFVNRVKQGQPVCQGEPLETPDEDDDELDVPDIELPIAHYFSNKPGGFFAIKAGDNLTKVAQKAYGIPANQTGNLRAAIECIVRVGYNLLFVGVPQDGDDYGNGKADGAWYNVNRATIPKNDDPRVAEAEGRKMLRRIGWETGTPVMEDNPQKFFPLWIPEVTTIEGTGGIACPVDATWDPDRNPPESVLAKIGWTLDEMREAWLQSGIAGPNA